jgi:hypothetical protein
LIALTVPLLGAFAASEPWYDDTSGLGLLYAVAALVALRLVSKASFWRERGMVMSQQWTDVAVLSL